MSVSVAQSHVDTNNRYYVYTAAARQLSKALFVNLPDMEMFLKGPIELTIKLDWSEACCLPTNGNIFSFHDYINLVVQFFKRKLTQNQSNSGVSMETGGRKTTSQNWSGISFVPGWLDWKQSSYWHSFHYQGDLTWFKKKRNKTWLEGNPYSLIKPA